MARTDRQADREKERNVNCLSRLVIQCHSSARASERTNEGREGTNDCRTEVGDSNEKRTAYRMELLMSSRRCRVNIVIRGEDEEEEGKKRGTGFNPKGERTKKKQNLLSSFDLCIHTTCLSVVVVVVD